MEAQALVADPDGRSFVALWLALDFRLRLWRWAIHLHAYLSQVQGRAPSLLAWFDPY